MEMTLLVYTSLLLLCSTLPQMTRANSDFDTENCGDCKCSWKSGKRFADCTNKRLKTIPTNMNAKIQVLDLSDNLIYEVRRNEFYDANLTNLHKLYMRNCSIEELNLGAFNGLSILIELDLSNNKIVELRPGLFSGLEKLRVVILNYNQIRTIDDNLFVNLGYLSKIELKNNEIETVGLRSFVNVSFLVQIELNNNNLKILYLETFEHLTKLASLSLVNNPWDCTCHLKKFRDFVISKNFYTTPTACASPKPLANAQWIDVISEDFACRPTIPKIFVHKQDNENVTFVCPASGIPTPKVSWYHNRKEVSTSDRIRIRDSIEFKGDGDVLRSELIIIGLKGKSDKGSYVCKAVNKGGSAESELSFTHADILNTKTANSNGKNPMIFIIAIAICILIFLLTILLVLYCCCRRNNRFKKNQSLSENGLVASKLEKSQNDSILDGSVIVEMQKSLLTEVNPVEKPPRRTEVDSSNDKIEFDDIQDVKKTLLDDTPYSLQDEETQSVTLSDSAPRSRATFVDDGYGTTLPPDLLSFPSRFPQSPSIQSSLSNIHEGRMYGKSPLSSPIYQHTNQLVAGQMPAGFRTLQHPKTGRTIAIAANRSNSPFTAAPLIYPQVVMKQGYMTIPRKPRTPSWAPSISSTTTTDLLPPTSPTSSLASQTEIPEPVYDNLGLRTTAAGSSTLKVNKAGKNKSNPPIKYTMKDRPLPATPVSNSPTPLNSLATYESIQMTTSTPIGQSDLEPLYSRALINGSSGVITPSSKLSSTGKIPPRPPPKPKKKLSVNNTSNVVVPNGGPNLAVNTSSTSQLFDAGEDGTEV